LTTDEAFAEWHRLRARNPNATAIDLYELVARPRGLEAHELPLTERIELGLRWLHEIDPNFEQAPNSERAFEPIELVLYDRRWPQAFASWKRRILSVLTPRRIDHIGSTSVPDLPAKPIIDIQVSVDNLQNEAEYVPAIESAGVQLRNRETDHRYFRPFADRPDDVHVHVCNHGSEWERRHLLFAAYLRRDAGARYDYAIAKQLAVRRWADDRLAYTEAKNGVIRNIMGRAEEWARSTSWTP
jgi:GrpB-like predicted nucleotidyltransferase (UPF0157 family)